MAKVFLRYHLLVDLLCIIKKYGQHPSYKFEQDEKLEKVRTGHYSAQGKTDATKQTLAIDSFTTIWFITLPEKFAEWNANHDVCNNSGAQATTKMNILETPSFPVFENKTSQTALKLTALHCMIMYFFQRVGTYWNVLSFTWNKKKCGPQKVLKMILFLAIVLT